MSYPSIEAIKLSKNYSSSAALSNLDLMVEGAKCVGLLGPNGAGKTTTLKIFTDMIRPTSGEAFINGLSVRKNKRRALSRCGSLIESPEIYPSLTASQAILMVAELRGIPRAERKNTVEEVLEQVRMLEYGEKKMGEMSKGMKQRVNIASALVGEPDILLLDEPTTGLDPRGMMEVRELIKSLKGKGKMIFMSSHLLNEVQDVCDELAIIENGKLLLHDSLANVSTMFSDRAKSVTMDIGLSSPVRQQSEIEAISSLPHVEGVEVLNPTTLRIRFSGGTENQGELLRHIGSMEIGMISFSSPTSALEETYLSLVKGSG